MAVIKLASFSGGGGVGIRAGRAFSQQYHDTLMYGWEFLGDPTVEVPQELLSRIEYLPDEDESTEYDLTDTQRRGWLAAFAKEYAHSEHLRKLCEYACDDWNYPIENPQVEDDEEKEVMEATTESSEDTHGGSEATKSIENSPSSADDGKEEKDNSASDGDNSDEGSSGKNGDTEADKEGNGTGTESKDGKGAGAPEDTDADKEGKGAGTEPSDGEEKGSGASVGGDSSEVTNKIVSDLISAFEEEANGRRNREAITNAFEMVLKNTKGKSDKGSRLGGWDGRAITKHYVSGMLNRIPADRKKYGAVKQVTVAIDCSGSCWTYLNEINRAIRHIARFYNVQILDCSNGFNADKDSTVSDRDPYDNRKRLEEAFCEGRIKMHPVITTPSIETAAKIAMESEAFIVLADYDGYLSICRVVQQVTNPAKCPWFLDLEERYEDPSDHDWNYDPDQDRYASADDYPVPARRRWLRLFDRGYGDDNE